MRFTQPAAHLPPEDDSEPTKPEHRSDGNRIQAAPRSSCGPRALCGWSPPPLAADTNLKWCVDHLLVGNAPALVMLAVVIGLFNLAPHLPIRADLAVDGVAALIGGGWCSLNFWRCRHAHCLVTGIGWLALAIFVFIESAIGRSLIGGNEQPVFIGVLAGALIFECAWYRARHTNAVGPD